MEEIWRDIDGFEGKYQVSTGGQVVSLNYNNTGKPRILKPKVNKQGYLEVTLNKNDKHHYKLVNRLVFEAFTGVKLGRNDIVANIDGDKLNPAFLNLKLMSRGKRQEISYEVGSRYVERFDFYGKKLTVKQMSAIKGINTETLKTRISRLKWGVEEAAEVPTSVYKRGNRK